MSGQVEFVEGWYTCRSHGQKDRYVVAHDETRVKYKTPGYGRLTQWRYVKRSHFNKHYVRNPKANGD